MRFFGQTVWIQVMKKAVVKSITAYQHIRDGILSGKYPPGSRLVLADLQKELNLGQGPVRDALMRLDRSGLVTNIPFKGALVNSAPSLEELDFIYQTKFVMEKLLAGAAMKKMTASKLNALQKEVEASKKDLDIPQKFFAHDRNFHLTFYETANMPHVMDIIAQLHEHVDIFLNTHIYSREYRAASIEHHEQMVIALQQKDPQALLTALEKNISLGLEYVRQRLAGDAVVRLENPCSDATDTAGAPEGIPIMH